jgi:hypothetical protein
MRYQYEEFVTHKKYAAQDLKKIRPIVLDKRQLELEAEIKKFKNIETEC